MESLAIIIGHSINGIIIALAVITIAGFAYVVMNITKLKASIDEKHKKNRSTEFTPGGIQKTPDAYGERRERQHRHGSCKAFIRCS